jgi:hypothetical protein
VSTIADACARRNAFHVCRERKGAGPIRFRRSNLRIAVADQMTELEHLAADADAAPPRIVLRHLQNQLLDLGIETGRPGPRRRPKAAHLLLTKSRCQPSTVSGWTSILTRAARLILWLSAAMIVRSAVFNCGLLIWRRTTRSWCRRGSSSASGLWTRSLTSTRSRSSRSQEYTHAKSIGVEILPIGRPYSE